MAGILEREGFVLERGLADQPAVAPLVQARAARVEDRGEVVALEGFYLLEERGPFVRVVEPVFPPSVELFLDRLGKPP